MPDHAPILRASEIGEYVFCHRAWWLHQVAGIESANRAEMQAGVERHAAHGRTVQSVSMLQRVALALLALALVFAAIAILSLR